MQCRKQKSGNFAVEYCSHSAAYRAPCEQLAGTNNGEDQPREDRVRTGQSDVHEGAPDMPSLAQVDRISTVADRAPCRPPSPPLSVPASIPTANWVLFEVLSGLVHGQTHRRAGTLAPRTIGVEQVLYAERGGRQTQEVDCHSKL